MNLILEAVFLKRLAKQNTGKKILSSLTES